MSEAPDRPDLVSQVEDTLEEAERAGEEERLAALERVHESLEAELDEAGSPRP